jgi:MFS family permease
MIFALGGEVHMKRILGFLLCLMLLATTVMSVSAQDRRRRSRFGRKARTAAIIGGGTVAGALIGGRKGAAIGAGASTMYAMNRKAARQHFKTGNRRMATVAGGTAAGAGLGAAIGHKKGAVIGALAGAGGSYVYTKKSRHYRRRY